MLAATAAGAWQRARAAGASALAFRAEGPTFTFATGALRGTLRGGGKSRGLIPIFDETTGSPLAKSSGLFSPYRLLDNQARYGPAAWDWLSEANLRADGSVEVKWKADAAHPFDLHAVYRWSAPDTLDLALQVTARQPLHKLEVFLASYFEGFPNTVVCAGGPAAFVDAPQTAGMWQMFPRDDEAVKTIQDGRWKHPPNPVDWTIRPRYTAPLAVRRDPERGLTAVLMTQPEKCFAVATPYDGEGHRSVYFSLFGCDLRPNESAATRARLRLGRELTNEQAVELYQQFLRQNPTP
jgi:hypothetical protein